MKPSVSIYILVVLIAGTAGAPSAKQDQRPLKLFHLEESKEDTMQNELEGVLAKNVKLGWWWDHKGVHNLTVGYKYYADSLLLQQNVYIPYKYFRVVDRDVYWADNRFVITYVEAIDQHSDPSEAGYASIKKGGVGNSNITVHLESARSHGLKYVVRISGHRKY